MDLFDFALQYFAFHGFKSMHIQSSTMLYHTVEYRRTENNLRSVLSEV